MSEPALTITCTEPPKPEAQLRSILTDVSGVTEVSFTASTATVLFEGVKLPMQITRHPNDSITLSWLLDLDVASRRVVLAYNRLVLVACEKGLGFNICEVDLDETP